MVESISRKRPWLAVVLAALVTGLGHLYLRRWRRAIGWLLGSFLVSILFVDPAAVEELAAGSWRLETLVAVAPMFVIIGLSMLDAYVLAHVQSSIDFQSSSGSGNASANAGTEPLSSDASGADEIDCPHCGKAVDPDLDFCHWCTRSLEDADFDRTDATNDD